MGFIASLFSGLKAEVEWLITSLAVATANSSAAAETQTADTAATTHHDDAASAKDINIPTLADQQPENTAADHHHAHQDSDSHNAGSDLQLADAGTDNPASLLINADFLVDTTVHSGAAPSPGLTPISFEPAASDLSSISALVSQSDQDFHASPAESDSHFGITQPHSAAGDFALASLAPQSLGDFQHGHGGGGTGGGTGGPTPSSYTSASANASFQLTLSFDSSVAKAPTDPGAVDTTPTDAHYNPSGNLVIADMEKVADFFTANYTTPTATHVTIDVGFGEIAGTGLGGGALGESEAFYVQAPTTSGNATQFKSLQANFNSLNGSPDVTLPTNNGGDFPGTHQYWVTTAEGKALNFANAQGQTLDGYVGFSGGAGTFDYNPNDGVTGYDFLGVAAHEISEVMGRVTLNGAKVFGHGVADYSPLDLFHYADPAPTDGISTGTHIFSGGTPGYFSIDNGTTDLKEFNPDSSGDFSDWFVPQNQTASDAYDWAGGQGMPSPVSYADYLVMEAVGWTGTFSGNWTPWDGQSVA